MPPPAEDRAEELFARTFDGRAEGAVRSPGRVNVIGDHTDYNDGFVLPIAIDRDTYIVFRPRPDGVVHLVSEHGPPVAVDLGAITHGEPAWAEYVRGVAWAMNVEPPLGWDGAIASDVPIGAGLSSSASLELAVAVVFDTLANGDRDPVRLALTAQRAEREWVGMECGIMDQLSVAAGTRGHALLIDCRSLDIEPKPVPTDAVFVVLDTATRRQLISSAYNERRATCERAAAALGVASLRDVGLADLEAAKTALDDVAWRRVRHVVYENDRVLVAAAAMERGEAAALGRLMTTSHQSLRDDYEASSPELDAIVSAALDAPGCLGARMTGAGFGGCAVALVERAGLDAFTPDVVARYGDETGLTAETYACVPAAGVSYHPRPAGGA
jgi:galactokinase